MWANVDCELPTAALGALTALRELDLANNRVRGVVPPSVWRLPHLRSLSLQANLLTDLDFGDERGRVRAGSARARNATGDAFAPSLRWAARDWRVRARRAVSLTHASSTAISTCRRIALVDLCRSPWRA